MSPKLFAPRGYQLLKLESQTDAKLRSFEEARGDIGNRIGEQKLRGEREKYLDRLRAQATITWRNTSWRRRPKRRSPNAGGQPPSKALRWPGPLDERD